jgi:hypothetical protein
MMDAKTPLQTALRQLLTMSSELTAAQLQAATGMSQPSISLALKGLGLGQPGGAVARLGAARSTRYALTHPIQGLPARHNLLCDGPDGVPRHFGELTYLSGNRVHVRSGKQEWLTQAALPWFLTPLQPQGFLGRELARLRPDFPADPVRWSLEQVLYFAVNHVREASGAFEVEGPAGAAHGTVHEAAPSLAQTCDQLAAQVGTSLPAGSSAAGEQPKFLWREPEGPRWLVKFSPPRGTPFGERWHALLHLEKLALDLLREHGVASAQTRIVESATRTFLLSRRFDQTLEFGYRHLVAAAAVHAQFVPTPRQHWVGTCRALVDLNLLSSGDLSTATQAYVFGQFIGNTDMHFGNLSFWVQDVVRPRFELAPIYDMLPMMWRPSIHSGSLDAEPLRAPHALAIEPALTDAVRDWAVDYWERAAEMRTLGLSIQAVCALNAQRLKTRFAGL